MKQNELKMMIRAIVKECVNEILAEKFMKSIIKETVQEAVLASFQGARANVVQRQVMTEERVEQPQQRKMTLGSIEEDNRRLEEFYKRKRQLQDQQDVTVRSKPAQQPTQPRKVMQESVLKEIANDTFRDVFEDTMNSAHPLVTGQDSGEDKVVAENPNDIPEHVMEAAGMFQKDWSRHIS